MTAPPVSLFDTPGPRAQRRARVLTWVTGASLAAIAALMVWRFWDNGQLEPEKWSPLVLANAWVNYLLPGLLATVKAAALAVVGAALFGLVFGLGRLSRFAVVRWTAGLVVEFFRAVPVLLMMIFAWLWLGYWFQADAISQDPSLLAVVIGLTLYNGSVVAELLRSGIKSLPRGQGEAAAAIGLRRIQSLWLIMLPQAIAAMTPALVAQLVVVLKDSALGFMVTYPELMRQAKLLGTANGNTLQTLILTAVLFIAVNSTLGLVAERLGNRLRGRVGRPAKSRPPVRLPG